MVVSSESLLEINAFFLTGIFNGLKSLYNYDSLDENRKNYLKEQVQKYGYLPYPHIKVLEELSPAETLFALEEKLKLNNTYNGSEFIFSQENISPAARAGYKNANWVKKEGHNIKLINLAGLGNGNASENPGKFLDWLKQLIILPAGNSEKGILSSTMYIIPFHPREFGCAYLPKSSEVSPNLEDASLKEKLELSAKNQLRIFLTLGQLAGHPTMYDVLPQTGRFSKTVLAAPHVARWLDVKSLISQLRSKSDTIAVKLAKNHNHIFVERVKNILQEELAGTYIPITDELKDIFELFDKELTEKKITLSSNMFTKENQEIICNKAKEKICSILGKNSNCDLTEEDITKQDEVIGELIKEGLWPAPGGAWCSSGVPVFDKMSEGAGYPMFKHFDNKGEDVTKFANLDCQTPYYFVYFDKGEYNEKVIDFYVNFLKKLQKDYNFDGFRVDHIDHIVDEVSEKDGFPISYRAPRKVLGKANSEIKKEIPHFAALAEYMLWDNFFKEYHDDMSFDLLWGSDIISQYLKDVSQIVKDNDQLEDYNTSKANEIENLSILKVYNNQDGEFREINQYPGQLGEAGALFKWLKLKLLPGGNLSSRPVMFIDGDESYTKTGIESVIGAEKSMTRNDNCEFFRKFDAINRFALNNNIILEGKAKILYSDKKSGLISWIIESPDTNEKLFVVANEKSPTEVTKNDNNEFVTVQNCPVCNANVSVPSGLNVDCEYIIEENAQDFSEKTSISNINGNNLEFEKLEPAEFHIYKLRACLVKT